MICRLTFLFVMMLGIGAHGQLRLPSFDIGVKAGYLIMWDDYQTSTSDQYFVYEAISAQADLNVHFGQHLALGWYYNRSVYSNYHEESSGNTATIDRDGEHLQYGLNFRLSAGRSGRLRPYLQAKYFWLQVAVQHGGYRAGNKFTGYGGGAGIMLRASHRLYINLIEADVCLLKKQEGIMFGASDGVPQFRAGLTYNLSKRK